MKRPDLLRRIAEALAAMIIVISVVIYSFSAISGIAGQAVSPSGNEALQAVDEPSGENSLNISQGTYQKETEKENEINKIAENNVNILQDGSTDAPVDQSAGANEPIAASPSGNQGSGDTAAMQAVNTANQTGETPAVAQASSENSTTAANNENSKNTPEGSSAVAVATLAAETAEKAANEQKALEPVYKYVQVDILNVRSGPSTETEKLGELKKGSRVQVLQQEDQWLKVITADNLNGYVYAEYTADTLPPVYKYVSVDKVNLRKGAGSDTEKLGTLYQGARVQVIEVLDKWINIITADNVKGYVFAEYVSDKAPVIYKYINSEKLNVRKGPDTETKKLATLQAGDRVQLLESKGEWSKIKTSDNVTGYIKTKYMVNSQKQVSRAESTAQPHNADLAAQILEYAQKFVGVKYVYGGSSPKGFDCSGFTSYVFEHFGISVPRSAAEYGSVGTKISRSDIKPGDIVLLDRYWNNELGHVGIYMGNDKFIHASSKKGKVVIAKLSEYSGTLLGIRRVIK